MKFSFSMLSILDKISFQTKMSRDLGAQNLFYSIQRQSFHVLSYSKKTEG